MASGRRVLFICVHNSGRSQMAEAFLNLLAGGRFYAESAGFRPTAVYPPVIEVMQEQEIDLSGKKTKNAFEFYRQGRLYDFVITVCDESAENECPVFPGIVKRLNWPFPDPEKVTGTQEEKLAGIRRIRDSIKARIEDWLKEFQD
ncbi:MAG: low molecular weight phosphatase family protein [Desulfobacteraceae bacterium IS3]|nr:MAG: low molecular weight phosphatase family protein [Desulfobacteraceae bacterium IS3]